MATRFGIAVQYQNLANEFKFDSDRSDMIPALHEAQLFKKPAHCTKHFDV
jgi:hypothetical protein